MKLEKQQIPQLIAMFYDSQIVPQTSGVQKFLSNMIGVVAADRASQIANSPMAQTIGEMVGVIDEQGYVDIVKAKEILDKTFDKNNNEVEFMGYIFDKSDVEALHKLASQMKGI